MNKINSYLNYTRESLYNLGAFDEIIAEDNLSVTISRKTGYVDLGSLSWAMSSAGKFYSAGVIKQISKTSQYDRCVCAKYPSENSGSLDVLSDDHISIDSSGYIQIRDDTYNDVSTFVSSLFNIQLQYELATSYNETVIKNKPINQLTQLGSQWVNDEYNKSTNLLPNSANRSANAESMLFGSGDFLSLPAGTYTLCSIGGTQSGAYAINLVFADGTTQGNVAAGNVGTPLTFTVSKTISRMSVYFNESVSNINVMLNKGTYNLPYQPYEGPIVRSNIAGISFQRSDATVQGAWANLQGGVLSLSIKGYFTHSSTSNNQYCLGAFNMPSEMLDRLVANHTSSAYIDIQSFRFAYSYEEGSDRPVLAYRNGNQLIVNAYHFRDVPTDHNYFFRWNVKFILDGKIW